MDGDSPSPEKPLHRRRSKSDAKPVISSLSQSSNDVPIKSADDSDFLNNPNKKIRKRGFAKKFSKLVKRKSNSPFNSPSEISKELESLRVLSTPIPQKQVSFDEKFPGDFTFKKDNEVPQGVEVNHVINQLLEEIKVNEVCSSPEVELITPRNRVIRNHVPVVLTPSLSTSPPSPGALSNNTALPRLMSPSHPPPVHTPTRSLGDTLESSSSLTALHTTLSCVSILAPPVPTKTPEIAPVITKNVDEKLSEQEKLNASNLPAIFFQNREESFFKKPKIPKVISLMTSVKFMKDATRRFNILAKLGQGTYGWVYKALDKRTGDTVAIKAIPLLTEHDVDNKKLATELYILQSLANCNNVVSYYGSYVMDTEIWIVLEFCDAGSVGELVTKSNLGLSESQLAACIVPLLRAIHHTHALGFIHRDIKGENVLALSDGTIKLADFGVASTGRGNLGSVAGSPYWMAPELISGEGESNSSSDIWSLGVTMIQLVDKVPPFYDYLPVRLFCLLTDEDEPPPHFKFRTKYSVELNDFLRMCLKKDPKKRPTAFELLQHPWVNGVYNEDLIFEKYIKKAKYKIENGTDGYVEEESELTDEEESSSERHPSFVYTKSARRSAIIKRTADNKLEMEEVEDASIFTVRGMVALMKHPEKGLKLKTRHHYFKSYKNCFVGYECVDWMMKNVKAQTREEAVALGQMLMLRGYIRHVSNQPFMDANAFYTFVSHEKEREEYAEPTAKELKAIATAMQHPTRGIELKDRRDFLFSFQDTFTGIEAKIWMEKYLSSKNYYLYSAEQILETLKDRGVFYACNKKLGPFKPDKEIYAFFSSEYQVSESAYAKSSALIRSDSVYGFE